MIRRWRRLDDATRVAAIIVALFILAVLWLLITLALNRDGAG